MTLLNKIIEESKKPVNACVHTYTKPQTSSTRSRGSAGEYMEV